MREQTWSRASSALRRPCTTEGAEPVSDQLLILLSEEGAEAERVAELTGYLREELLDLDVDDVTPVPAGEVPLGARAVDVTQVGSLLVALGGSATALHQVITVLRSWLSRSRDTRPSLRLQMDDDVIEVSKATDTQVAEAFTLFVQRHSTAGDLP
ncbi:hypothetical protein [Streptomyces sp. JB150]|uniref:hypothetical protein n=1 Tax=Streptomyces sp. JB150 TaxID=2714844 RepID=UPI00140C353A|nr:hypothetical protein [Streptomyces sp. JB150]QIJ62002.1 hypothetical protein G7Z13_08080 [Streptomyces sp. JB150]